MKKVKSIKPTGVLADMIEDFKKDLLLKDLAARIPYGVKAEVTEAYWHGVKNVPIEPTIKVFTAFDYDQYACGKYYQVGVSQSCIISVKPYLRPMSDMTEEEKVDLINSLHDIALATRNYICSLTANEPSMEEKIAEIDYLNEHMFDYRGLIEKGLALEAPKGMYKFEEEEEL